jgi:hypothetical protein
MPWPFFFGFKTTIVGTPFTSTPKACINCPAIFWFFSTSTAANPTMRFSDVAAFSYSGAACTQ